MKKYSKLYIALSLFLGLVFGVGLLSYSGDELVNVMVFLTVAVFVPLLFSLFSFGMIVYNLFKKELLLWQSLKYSNQIGFLFSLGIFVSFVMVIASQDVAFGWSTTLDLSSKDIRDFLGYFAFWKEWLPTAFIDEKLIELSHFNRLGQEVTKQQIDNAQFLGSWWKFLAMMVLVWGVGVRFLLCQISRMGIKIGLSKSKVEHISLTDEQKFIPLSNEYKNRAKPSLLEDKKYQILGWSMLQNELEKILKSYKIQSSSIHLFANSPDLDDDIKELQNLSDVDTIIVVKAWEPPTMEFIDFLDDIAIKSKIYLLGSGDKKEVNIWLRKLKETSHEYIISIN